jgi:hypothetical protein
VGRRIADRPDHDGRTVGSTPDQRRGFHVDGDGSGFC